MFSPFYHHFLHIFNRQYGRTKTLKNEALRALSVMPWAGNVRQLQNSIQYAVLVNSDLELGPNSFGQGILENETPIPPFLSSNLNLASEILTPSENLSLKIATERLEAMWIKEAFQRVSTQEEAAKLLGISRGALQYKIKNNQFLIGYNS